jgi:hypothetical protein
MFTARRRVHASPALAGIALLTAAGSALAVPPAIYSTVATSGQPAPGLPALTFSRVNGLTLNDSGQWVFHAVLAGSGVTSDNDGSLWTNRDGPLTLAYREGNASPIPSNVLASLSYPALNTGGTLSLTSAFVTTPASTAPTKLGVFIETKPGSLMTVAADAFAAPGLNPPTVFSAILPAPLSLGGLTAISANNGNGLWSDRTGSLALVVGAGTPVPDIEGATFAHVDPASQNIEGGAAFRARVTGTGITSANNAGVWIAGAITRLLARTGDQAPGFAKGVVFSELALTPAIEASAAVTFWARVAGPGVVPGADQAIYTTRLKDPLTSLVKAGDPAAGIFDGALYYAFGAPIVVNDAGDAAFIARLAGPLVTPANNGALYVFPASAGEPRLVAREGDQVFNGTGIVFEHFVRPALNGFGRVALLAYVSGTGITSGNNLWLLAEGPDHRLVRVAATGQSFQVSPGVFKTVRDVSFEAGNAMEGHSQFAIDSTLAFRLNFTDFTDALVTARVTCGPDWNTDGVVNSTDVSDFINDWFGDQVNGTVATDFNFDGVSNSTDVSDFINAWFGGCEGY